MFSRYDREKFYLDLMYKMRLKNPEEAEICYNGLTRYIVQELKNKDIVELPNLGKFISKEHTVVKLQIQNLRNRKEEYTHPFIKNKIKFRCCKALELYLNAK